MEHVLHVMLPCCGGANELLPAWHPCAVQRLMLCLAATGEQAMNHLFFGQRMPSEPSSSQVDVQSASFRAYRQRDMLGRRHTQG